MPHRLPELADIAVLYDAQPAAFQPDLAFPGGKAAHKARLLRSLRDIDEPAGPGDLLPKAADIHIALPVKFSPAQARHINAAAIIQVKDIRLLYHGIGIVGGAGQQAALWRPAYRPGFNAERHPLQPFLLGQYIGDEGRHPDPEINKVTVLYFRGGPAGHHLLMSGGTGGSPSSGMRTRPVKASTQRSSVTNCCLEFSSRPTTM